MFYTHDLRFFQSLISSWPAGPGLAPVKLLRAAWPPPPASSSTPPLLNLDGHKFISCGL